MHFSTILLDGAQPGADAMGSILMIVILIVIFYFFMIRPQQKRQKKLKQQREAMGKGDTIVTAGGIYGRIVDVRDDSFIVEIDKNVKIRIDKNSVYPSVEQANEAAAQNPDTKK